MSSLASFLRCGNSANNCVFDAFRGRLEAKPGGTVNRDDFAVTRKDCAGFRMSHAGDRRNAPGNRHTTAEIRRLRAGGRMGMAEFR